MTRRSEKPGTVDPLDKKIGARLRHFRELAGYSQASLADAKGVKVTFQQIHRYENGANRIATATLIMLLQALDVPVAEFFDGILRDKPALTVDGRTRRDVLEMVNDYEALPSDAARQYARQALRQLAQIAKAS